MNPSILESLETRRLFAFVTWDGEAGNNDWHTPLNWSSNQVPTPADDAFITLPGANVFCGGADIRGLQLTNATLSVVTDLNISNAARISLGGVLNLYSGTLRGTGPGGLRNDGSIYLDDGGVLDMPVQNMPTFGLIESRGNTTSIARLFNGQFGPELTGTVRIRPDSNLSIPGGKNRGTLELLGNSALFINSGTGPLVNTGSIRALSVTGGGTAGASIHGDFTNFGLMQLDQSTTIQPAQSAQNYGTIRHTQGNLLVHFPAGRVVNDGLIDSEGNSVNAPIDNRSGGSLRLASGMLFNGYTSIQNDGLFETAGGFRSVQTYDFNQLANGRLKLKLSGAGAGIGHDQIRVEEAAAGQAPLAGTLELEVLSPQLPLVPFTLIDVQRGMLTGAFIDRPEGSVSSFGGADWHLSYRGGDGNDVTLTPVPVSLPSVRLEDASVTEGNSGQRLLEIRVSLSAPASAGLPVTVNYYTGDLTATAADGDYAPTGGTLQIDPGQTQAVIRVPVFGDTTIEADERFLVHIASAQLAQIADGSAVATILSDDRPGPAPWSNESIRGIAIDRQDDLAGLA